MFPRFLGIGAQKAGTTWLHAMLSEHEDIWLPHLKELHYFDRKFPTKQAVGMPAAALGRGVFSRNISNRLQRIDAATLMERQRYRRWKYFDWEFRYLFGEWNDEWYASLFDAARDRLAGEITPAYSCMSETAIPHVHGLMPDARLILLLRLSIEPRSTPDRHFSIPRDIHGRMPLAAHCPETCQHGHADANSAAAESAPGRPIRRQITWSFDAMRHTSTTLAGTMQTCARRRTWLLTEASNKL